MTVSYKNLSSIIFIITFSTVALSLVSVVFPVFIPSIFQEPQVQIDKFELGLLGIPLLISNLLILIISVLYYKRKLPNFLPIFFNYVKNFETSKRTTIIAILAVLSIYVFFSYPELAEYEGDQIADFKNVEIAIGLWPSSDPHYYPLYVLHVKNFFLKSSEILFFNIKVIPFLASIAVLLLTYFVTREIAKKRFAGLISFIVLIQSPVFLRFDSTATYANFWILFYLLSVFLVSRAWFLSPISYVASIFSKPITLAFIPLIWFTTLNSKIQKKKKILLSSFYGIFLIILLITFFAFPEIGGLVGVDSSSSESQFSFEEFLLGFTKIAHLLRHDWFFLLFVLPLTVGLYYLAKNGKHHANSIQVQIFGILLVGFFIEGFFVLITTEVYRLVIVIVFFAIGVGILFSKKKSNSPVYT